MKKILITTFCFFTFFGFSQMTMKKLDGTPIIDGDVIVFNSYSDPDSYLGFKIYNSSNDLMRVKVRCQSIMNSTGDNLQFCIDPICVGQLVVGTSYPSGNPSLVPANGQNGNFDHLLNTNPGINPNSNVEYVMKFYQLDDSGNEVGNAITFTYRYQPLLANNNFNQLESIGVKIKSTLISNLLEFENTTDVSFEMYDLSGKLVRNSKFSTGNQSVDVSNMSSGSYVLSFTDNKGSRASKQILKK